MAGVRHPLGGVIYPSAEDVAAFARLGIFSDETMDQAFGSLARQFGDRIALRDATTSLTFAALDERTDLIAAGLLRAGLQPNDRVIFQLVNAPELVVLLLACLKAGLVPVCTLAAHRMAEIGYLARHAGARAHVIHADARKFDFLGFADEVRTVVPSVTHTIYGTGDSDRGGYSLDRLVAGMSPDEARRLLADVPKDPWQVAMFQLSGGTSGVPKIIPRFHNEYLYQIRGVARFHGLNETTVAFSPAPMLHNAPIVCYWGSVLWSGGTVVCCAEMSAKAFAETIAKTNPNWLAIPLPLLVKLDAEGLLNRAHFAGARFSAPGNATRIEALTGGEAVALYGMTEGIITYAKAGDPDVVRTGMVGRPISTHDEFRIVDPDGEDEKSDGEPGEFVFRGPCSIRGYYDAPERNREALTSDGFVRSGDLMSVHVIDGTRFLKFEGRVKDVVSRGGEKINCQEVEQILLRHPSVGAIAIVPIPDRDYGERACAFIIPLEGKRAPSVAEVGAFLEQAGIAKFKWPERIETTTAFPMTGSGKLSKPKLKEIAAGLVRGQS